MAYTGNAAIFPRNKFSISTPRKNQFVRTSKVDSSAKGGSGTILATEFFYNKTVGWSAIGDGAVAGSSSWRSKSHRPIMPFLGISSGVNVYQEPDRGNVARYRYPEENEILAEDQVPGGLMNDQTPPPSLLNAVGRHHAGGTANFSFVDGHVETITVLETVQKRLWGDRVHSLTGNNRVDLDR